MTLGARFRSSLLGLSPADMQAVTHHFRDARPALRERLDGICDAFRLGYNAAMVAEDADALIAALDEQEPDLRGWTYEGAGMGVAIRVQLTPGSRLLAEYLERGDAHLYLIEVGVGWALGKVPLRHGAVWGQTGTDYHWLAWDGWGFHDAVFRTERALVKQAGRPAGAGEGASYDQGLGRALWFVECAEPERIATRIGSFHPDRRADLWGGVGLAACYACGVDEDTLRAALAQAGAHAGQVRVGASLAALARARAGNLSPAAERACRALTGRSAEEAAATARALIEATPSGPEHYHAVRRALLAELPEAA